MGGIKEKKNISIPYLSKYRLKLKVCLKSKPGCSVEGNFRTGQEWKLNFKLKIYLIFKDNILNFHLPSFLGKMFSGSFTICHQIFNIIWFVSFFVFWSKLPIPKKSAFLFVYILYKKSAFCLKMTTVFFVFWSLCRKTKNETSQTKLYFFCRQLEVLPNAWTSPV